ncbi:hypothetical protein [Sphingopyxis sp. MSC1_008]|jgi:hypothetical protein|uniref:hypothetical protein n=1 Tax=Sphingopyxis sp. MSC1_008 TaxID=2909265 RepID=UPI0020BE934B|nr:hypothetical protein [Sphingopyxis sp. MSC1_008]
MDAPTYPPARAWEAPTVHPSRLSVKGSSIQVLMEDPGAWAIVTKELPAAALVAKSPGAKALIDNVSLQILVDLGFAKPGTLDRIDAQLAELESAR